MSTIKANSNNSNKCRDGSQISQADQDKALMKYYHYKPIPINKNYFIFAFIIILAIAIILYLIPIAKCILYESVSWNHLSKDICPNLNRNSGKNGLILNVCIESIEILILITLCFQILRYQRHDDGRGQRHRGQDGLSGDRVVQPAAS